MVRATKGTFILTEPSLKEIILLINEKENFVIEELNDNGLFIKTGYSVEKDVETVLNGILKPRE